jgi:MSHA pilin protein MshC
MIQAGFSLLELVIVISLVSIIAVYAIPKLNLDVFRETGYVQQAAAAIRYAQKQAIASGCSVEVAITAGGCNVNWNNPSAAAGCPADNTDIPNPGTGNNDFCEDSTPGATGDLPTVFTFDKIGRPSAAQSIDLGDKTLAVEAETGYTHEI